MSIVHVTPIQCYSLVPPPVMPPRLPCFDTTRGGRRGRRIMAASCSPFLFFVQAPIFIPCAGSPRGWQDVKRKKGVHGKSIAMWCFLGTAVWFWFAVFHCSSSSTPCMFLQSWELLLCTSWGREWTFQHMGRSRPLVSLEYCGVTL